MSSEHGSELDRTEKILYVIILSTTLSTTSPRQHALLLPQDLENSLAKPSLQTHYLIGIVWYVPPFSPLIRPPITRGLLDLFHQIKN